MNVLLPSTIWEACDMLAQTPGAVPLAGATDLLVHWPIRPVEHDRTYLDLSGIAELRGLQWSHDTLRLGAMATYWDVITSPQAAAEFPILIQAARQVGAVQIQSRGTWAGNIANGSPAADGVPVLMACDAVVELTSVSGVRTVPLADYSTGYRTSVRRPDELITAISIPRVARDVQVFHKVGPRRAQAIAKVGLAVVHRADAVREGSGESSRWRVVASSVAPTVRRCPHIEALLDSGAAIDSPDAFLPAAAADIAPIDDIRSTAEYRRAVFCRVLYHSLRPNP